jgi:sodium transport system permease protein
MSTGFWRNFRVVALKEIIDALRDRRTLLRLMVPALLMGPVLLLALSALLASFEERAEKREILAVGLDKAPTLRNFLERQTYTVKDAPADYEAKLRERTLTDPVLVVGDTFEQDLLRGERPTLEIVSDSANQRAAASVGSTQRMLMGFNQERAVLNLALRGVSGELLQSVVIEERDLASAQARASRFTSIIPMFIIMAVLYGALTASLDSTAGERERGSLEPLLMNPVQHLALVAGKWSAVGLLGLMMGLLASLSFIPAQWLIKSDSLQAMFQFGVGEVLPFILLQVPLAAGMGAGLMAVAIRSKTFKEAQASSGLWMTLVGMSPMVAVMNPGGDAWWYLWLPGLAQNTMMLQVLKGESLSWLQIMPSVAVGLALTVGCLWFVAHSMRQAVSR